MENKPWLHLILKCFPERLACIILHEYVFDLNHSFQLSILTNPIPFLVLNSSQSDNGTVLSRRGSVQFIPWPGGTGLGGFWGVLVKLQPLYKVSCSNCVHVCMCVFGDFP